MNMKSVRMLVGITACIIFALTSQIHAAEMSFARGIKDQQDIITIQGAITLGDENRFRRLALNSNDAIVFLDSPGGLVFPALEIGKMIRVRGFSTAVQDAKCNSACAFIWLAGSPRVMNNAATIGFHAPYVDGKNGKKISTAVQGARIGAYLATLGFSEDVVSFAVTGSAEEVRWLNKKTADRLGISVSFTTPDQRVQALSDFREALKAQALAKPDYVLAVKLYRESAQMGFAGAQNNLGDKYENGLGVPKDPIMAAYWYTRAAERGEPTAYLSLASLLYESSKEPEVLIEAGKFAQLAANTLPPGRNKGEAEKLVNALTNILSDADKYRVLFLVKRWAPLNQERYLMGDKPQDKSDKESNQ